MIFDTIFKYFRQANILHIHSPNRSINKPFDFLQVQVCYMKSRNVTVTPTTAECLKNLRKILSCNEERAREICSEYPDMVECGSDVLVEKFKYLKINKLTKNTIVENPFLLLEDNGKSLSLEMYGSHKILLFFICFRCN